VTTTELLIRLLQRYARGVDVRDIDLLASLFDPDAVVIGAGGTLSSSEWLDTMRAPRSFPASMHMIGTPLVSGTADPGAATMDTYAVVYQLGESKDSDLTMGIRYVDDVVLVGDDWVFKRRESRILWTR
jgi:SnoaL-like domain